MDVEAERRKLSQTFDGVAELYEEVRPRYPAALVEHVVETSEIDEESRILEVGAGPGNATLAFARRGYDMTCLEPGPKLAALLRQNTLPYPRVGVEVERFEDWELEPESFDLVISGQAFHWVDPGVAYEKTAAALLPGGWLALFWNRPDDTKQSAAAEAILKAYAAEAPELLDRGGHSLTGHGPPEERIDESGCFEKVSRELFPWTARYDAEQYGKLMRTHSDHRALPPTQLDALVEAGMAAVRANGGVYEVPQVAILYMARRLPG